MLNSLRNIWKTSREIASRERVCPAVVFADMFWCYLRYGATREDYLVFDFAEKSAPARAKIVTYKKYRRIEKWFNDPATQKIVDDKRGFLKNYGEFLGREFLILSEASTEQIRAFLEKFSCVIQKPENSSQGSGVVRRNSADLLADEKLFSEMENGGGVLEECLVQHPEMAAINSSCVNTVRVNSVVDGNGRVEIFSAVIIAGTTEKPINHLHAGGVMYPVDLTTGTVYAWGLDFERKRHVRHPSTGTLMPGFRVPLWREILAMVEKAALKTPRARFIGWDVALTRERPVILEANFGAGNTTYQWWDKGGQWNFLKSKR